MRIFLHSFSDVITNSSEVIYICPTSKTIDAARKMINYFLKKAGSSKVADDLFTFKLELDEAYIERIIDDLGDSTDLCDKPEEVQHEEIRKLVESGKINPSDYDIDGYFRQDHLIIIPRDDSKDTLDLTSEVEKIFDIEASRDG